MTPFQIISGINKLIPGTVLDIGTRDCSYATKFADAGYKVDAIDPHILSEDTNYCGISFQQTTLEKFQTEKKYDLVIASLVSHLVSYSIPTFISRLASLTASDGLIYVTLIGDKDDWAKFPRAKAMPIEEVQQIISDNALAPIYKKVYQEDGFLYSGESKYWHLFTFVLVVKNNQVFQGN